MGRLSRWYMYLVVCDPVLVLIIITIQWNLPYLDLYYPGTSIVWTAQIGHVACSLLTIMKFGLDKSTRREPKDCCLPVWWLVYSTTNNYHLVAR